MMDLTAYPQAGRLKQEFLRLVSAVPPLRFVFLLITFTLVAASTGNPQTASRARALWSANMETGDLSQWYFPSTHEFGNHGGGEYNSGIASARGSRDVAHSGRYSAKLTISTPSSPTSGVRLFRWAESHSHRQLWYSVWYYFPRRYSIAKWWNIWQWKSKRAAGNDPFFVLNVGNRPTGEMYFYLRNQHTNSSYRPNVVKNIPVGKWFRVEAVYLCAGDRTGHVTFWQDGVQIFDVADVQTRYADGDCQWSVNNYSSGLTPSTATIYIDDAAIHTTPIGGDPSP